VKIISAKVNIQAKGYYNDKS